PPIFSPGSCRNLGAGTPELRLPGYNFARLNRHQNGAGRQNPAGPAVRDGFARRSAMSSKEHRAVVGNVGLLIVGVDDREVSSRTIQLAIAKEPAASCGHLRTPRLLF
ncbi:MAG: hypothetical protein ABW200_12470, partial [Hyphomicrobiaceae bacterium]